MNTQATATLMVLMLVGQGLVFSATANANNQDDYQRWLQGTNGNSRVIWMPTTRPFWAFLTRNGKKSMCRRLRYATLNPSPLPCQ